VEYYGAMTPLKAMANASTPDAQTISIQPFDKSAIKDIERALVKSDLGITPSNDGNVIRLVIPQLTQERRKELTKLVGKLTEEGKVALRNARRDALKALEKLEKDKALSEDELTAAKDAMQKLTDGCGGARVRRAEGARLALRAAGCAADVAGGSLPRAGL
jgi:ribosome recycling factor